MGVLWVVLPVVTPMREYLDKLGIVYPQDSSRLPTGAEIKGALAMLEGYQVEVTDCGPRKSFDAFISSPEEWTSLVVYDFTGDDAEQRLSFSKGHVSLILRVLKLLTPSCGPLALIADTGDDPIVVSRQGELTGGLESA